MLRKQTQLYFLCSLLCPARVVFDRDCRELEFGGVGCGQQLPPGLQDGQLLRWCPVPGCERAKE